MAKVLMNIVLTRLSSFYESQLLKPSLGFVLVKDSMMTDMLSNNSEKLLTSLIGNCIPALLALQKHMTTSIETSSSHPLKTTFQAPSSLNSPI